MIDRNRKGDNMHDSNECDIKTCKICQEEVTKDAKWRLSWEEEAKLKLVNKIPNITYYVDFKNKKLIRKVAA